MADVMGPPQAHSHQDIKPKLPPSTSSTPVSASSSRRPPRKSTLTQQQKNQKRQRATQDQLMTLEIEFNKNPTPTALVRERIASDINMTERSVQIWFQNRRAKIKNIAKRSIESGEDCDSIPDSMRQYLAMQSYSPGKGLSASMFGRGPGMGSYGPNGLAMNADAASGKTVIQHFHCRSLSIGSWRRVGQSTMDLVIFYSPEKGCITYYINNDAAGYKIEYPFAAIKNISLEQGDVLAAAEGASQRSGGLVVELNRPPKFFMDSSGSGGFYECGDFTEDQQASKIMVHHLGGPSKVLSGQLAKLVSLESYQHRHSMFDPAQFAVSAPVSPVGHRPASQPNHVAHPYSGHELFQQNAPGLMGPPGPRGHKRQRSRSVPAAIDFSMFQHPMPSFLIQHDGMPAPSHQQPQAHVQNPNIFAPVPQHQHQNNFNPDAMGPGLSIDTSASYGMDLRHFNGPMSATTANSPSEFGTPAFFTSAPSGETLQTPQFQHGFNHGFLSVDQAAMIGTSNTPLSMAGSHGDPIIADHSPPLNSHGNDVFGTPGDSSQFGDDSLFLSESFNKQIGIPFRSPMSDESFQSPMPHGSLDGYLHSPPGGMSEAHGGQVFSNQDQMNFQHTSNPVQDGSAAFQSPSNPEHAIQMHQDSGVSFSTPPHISEHKSAMYNTPSDSGMLYQDSKMYQSPGQMQHLSDDQQMYHNSPLAHGSTNREDVDLQNMGMYGTVDPNNLGQHRQTHQQQQ
ncbi:hypothetical protein MBLNU230_g0133t1 [Neophaeotheca triangularis]